MTVSLKPSGFFDQNPALDVPQSTQKSNGSRRVEDKALVASVREQSYHKVRDSRL
jgi:primary-amine oxidase